MSAVYPPQQNRPQSTSQPMSTPALPLETWGATDKGCEREGNEDAVYPHSGSDTFPFQPGMQHLAQKGQLLVVADGVGGAQAGSQASRWAIRVAVEQYYDLPGPDLGADLRAAVEHANTSLYQYLQSTGTREAGSTMAAAVVHGSTLYVANAGDSRIYLIRNGQITQLTRDHTLTQQKIDRGLIRPEQAEMDPDRSVLTRSLGAGPTLQADLFPPLQLAPGDIVLLCSDGLTDMLGDEEIARLVKGSSPKRATRRLIAAANKRGGFDNISVVIARAGGKQPPAGGGLLDSIKDSTKGMSQRQKITLLVGAVLVAAALCAMAALGWWMHDRRQATPTPTPTPTATVETVATVTAPAVVPATVQPTDTVLPGHPTSTPRPTNTPPPTPTQRRPLAATYTPTATMLPEPTRETPPSTTEPGPQPTQPPQPTVPPPTQKPEG